MRLDRPLAPHLSFVLECDVARESRWIRRGDVMREVFGLEGEPALVVGGGYGSGRLTAMLLVRAGARVGWDAAG